jgi:hypothetical protein
LGRYLDCLFDRLAETQIKHGVLNSCYTHVPGRRGLRYNETTIAGRGNGRARTRSNGHPRWIVARRSL